jgi:hypothetical protein
MAPDVTIYQRLSAIETDVAELKGSMEGVAGKLDQLLAGNNSSSLYQKGLLGAIIVQALLSGLATPETARNLLTQILGGAH